MPTRGAVVMNASSEAPAAKGPNCKPFAAIAGEVEFAAVVSGNYDNSPCWGVCSVCCAMTQLDNVPYRSHPFNRELQRDVPEKLHRSCHHQLIGDGDGLGNR